MHVIDGKLLTIFVGIQQIFICFDDKINPKAEIGNERERDRKTTLDSCQTIF